MKIKILPTWNESKPISVPIGKIQFNRWIEKQVPMKRLKVPAFPSDEDIIKEFLEKNPQLIKPSKN